jgi:hypothetical protein
MAPITEAETSGVMLCDFCPIEEMKFSNEAKECLDCPEIENCDICMDQTRCLKCQEGMWLSMDDF